MVQDVRRAAQLYSDLKCFRQAASNKLKLGPDVITVDSGPSRIADECLTTVDTALQHYVAFLAHASVAYRSRCQNKSSGYRNGPTPNSRLLSKAEDGMISDLALKTTQPVEPVTPKLQNNRDDRA